MAKVFSMYLMSLAPYACATMMLAATLSPMRQEMRKNRMGREVATAAMASWPSRRPTQNMFMASMNVWRKLPMNRGTAKASSCPGMLPFVKSFNAGGKWCALQESNLYTKLRRLGHYPLC